MSYDNTKFLTALKAWLEANTQPCALDGTYGGALLDDFCEFLSETGLMKRSPGRVVFGKALREFGYDTYRHAGLTCYAGIELKKPRPYRARRTRKTEERAEAEARAREKLQRQTVRLENEQERQERIRQIQAEIQTETAERARKQEEQDLERFYAGTS